MKRFSHFALVLFCLTSTILSCNRGCLSCNTTLQHCLRCEYSHYYSELHRDCIPSCLSAVSYSAQTFGAKAVCLDKYYGPYHFDLQSFWIIFGVSLFVVLFCILVCCLIARKRRKIFQGPTTRQRQPQNNSTENNLQSRNTLDSEPAETARESIGDTCEEGATRSDHEIRNNKVSLPTLT